jgi:hypothetical protein
MQSFVSAQRLSYNRPKNDNILSESRSTLVVEEPVLGRGRCMSSLCDTITMLGIQPRCSEPLVGFLSQQLNAYLEITQHIHADCPLFKASTLATLTI